MDRLSKDELFLIAIDLDVSNILNLCRTSKNINQKICNNNVFWVRKLKKDFNVDFYLDNKDIPRSSRLRDKYIKSSPAKNQYLQYNQIVEKYKTLNHLLSTGIQMDNINLIKISLFRGAVYDLLILKNAMKVL